MTFKIVPEVNVSSETQNSQNQKPAKLFAENGLNGHLLKKGKQSIGKKKKWVSCHSVIPIPVHGSSRHSQVHLTGEICVEKK